MLFNSIRIRNYKGFDDSGIVELGKRWTVIVGRNNAGKSALLEAFAFTAFKNNSHHNLAHDPKRPAQRESSIELSVSTSADELRTIFLSSNANEIAVPIPHANPTKEFVETKFFEHDFDITLSKTGTSSWQSPKYPSHGLFEVVSDTNFSCKIVPAKDRTDWRTQTVSRNGSDTIAEILAPAIQASAYVFRAERRVPARAPMKESLELNTDGSNLPSVLHYLFTSNQSQFQRYLQLVQRVLPEVQAITTPPEKGEVVIKIWNSGYPEERSDLAIPLDQCGTGIGQVLAILFVLVTVRTSRVIVIDEPNSFLHPGASRVLMQVLRSFNRHQFVVSTHSPEIIRATQPDKMIVARWEKGASRVAVHEGDALNGVQAAFDELGVHLSDVFGYDGIVWVEGKTEEKCFPELLRAGGKELPTRMAFIAVVNTGDLDGQDADLVWRIYKRLSMQSAFAPSAIAISLDMETRTKEFRAALAKQSNGLLRFLPRRTFENYLLHPSAIAAVLAAESGTPPISVAEVDKWIASHRDDPKYHRGVPQAERNDWTIHVDAPKLLHDLFKELTNATHDYSSRKAHFSFALTSWLIANDPSFLREIIDYVIGLLGENVPQRRS